MTAIRQVAVIGAGMAGSSCAQALTLAGHTVQVFDKSRGPGGRMATRRLEWRDRDGEARTTGIDHGAVSVTARSAAFQAFVNQALQAGFLAEWKPLLAAGSLPVEDGAPLCVPVPDLPALCRHLLDGTAATWSFAVDSLQRRPLGWQVAADGLCHPTLFDAVVLALPPAQAAPLLKPHRPEWAGQAAATPMLPCWTLMGIADDPGPTDNAPQAALQRDLARPPTGELAWVLRNDSRPGRDRRPGQAHWVVHASAGWSQQHLEQSADWVQRQLQAALDRWLGRAVDWQHLVVHRWRYALPQAQTTTDGGCWWDADLGLGVCGDFLGGASVEGAWLSGLAMSAVLPQRADSRGR